MRTLYLFLILLCWVPLPAAAQARDGKFSVAYLPSKTQQGAGWERSFRASQYFEKLAEAYNREFYLPRDVLIVLGETGVANCWYTPSEHRIYMTYDMVEELARMFSAGGQNPEAAQDTLHCMHFIFLHEMGHCLINELDLPTTGKEEDCADAFAVITLTQNGPFGTKCAVAAARWFGMMSQGSDHSKLPFWDEHSLNQQRFYDTFGMLYGSNPNRFMFVEKLMPRERLARHEREFGRKKRSWERLFNQHLRNPKNLQ